MVMTKRWRYKPIRLKRTLKQQIKIALNQRLTALNQKKTTPKQRKTIHNQKKTTLSLITSTNLPKPTNNLVIRTSPSTHKSNGAETIILCDSNGRYLKPKLLCPDSTTSYIRCPTLTKVRHIIQNTNFTNPKTFIIHCGTNDIEQLPPDQNLVTEINDIISSIRGKYPQSRIIISALLPRKDELNKLIPPINHGIEKALHTIPNTSFIHHNNINIDKDLHDKKHLNDKGVKVFAKNIKATYFNTTPKKRNFPNFSQQQNHPVTYNNQPNPFSSGYHYPPFIPTFKLPPTNMNAQPKTNMSSHQFSQRKPSTMSLPPQLIELIKQLYGCIN